MGAKAYTTHMSKYTKGTPVTLTASRFMDTDHEYSPYKFKYKDGDTGTITEAWPNLSEVPDREMVQDYLDNEGEWQTGGPVYTVQIGMGEKYLVPESDISPLPPIRGMEGYAPPPLGFMGAVEDYLAEKQKNKEFKDTKHHITGTAKEKRAYKMVLSGDLAAIEAQGGRFAEEMVTKDKVYPKVDVNAEQSAGHSPGSTYLKTELRKACAPKGGNTPEKRKFYTAYIENLVAKMAEVYDMETFEDACKEIYTTTKNVFLGTLFPELSEKIKEEHANKQSILADLRQQKASINGFESIEGRQLYNQIQAFDVLDLSPTEYKIDQKVPFRDNRRLLAEIFGKRFRDILAGSGDNYREYWEKAESYEALSPEASRVLIDLKTATDRQSILDINNEIAVLNGTDKAAIHELLLAAGYGYSSRLYKFDGLADPHAYYHEFIKPPYHKKYGHEAIEKWADIYRQLFINTLQKRIQNYVDSISITENRYRTREADWSWADSKANTGKKKSELVINSGVPLDYIKRTGGVAVYDSDVSVGFLTNTMGFKTVTFETSMRDVETKEHVRHFIGAVADLCELLDIDLHAFMGLNSSTISSDNGGLSMWFGAGSGGGKAMAYYKGNGCVINLTRKRGDGTVAHEFFHYIDQALATIGREASFKISDWASGTLVPRKGEFWNREVYVANEQIANILLRMNYYIMFNKNLGITVNEKQGYGEPKYRFSSDAIAADQQNAGENLVKITFGPKKRTGDYGPSLNKLIPAGTATIDEYFELLKQTKPQFKYQEDLTKNSRDVLDYIVGKFGFTEYTFEFGSRTTMYQANCNAMSSDYWSRRHEMFARAFECYIYDKLASLGRANNYLVSGDMFGYSEGIYPAGKERERINAMFDELFAAIRDQYQLPKFVPFRTERTDEFTEIKDDGTAVVPDTSPQPQGGVISVTHGEAMGATDNAEPINMPEALAELKASIRKMAEAVRDNKIHNETQFSHGGLINENDKEYHYFVDTDGIGEYIHGAKDHLISKVLPTVTEQDYFLSTKALFNHITIDEYNSVNVAEHVSMLPAQYRHSESLSKYKIKDGYVYRCSDHWGKVGTCVWVYGPVYGMPYINEHNIWVVPLDQDRRKAIIQQDMEQLGMSRGQYNNAWDRGRISTDFESEFKAEIYHEGQKWKVIPAKCKLSDFQRIDRKSVYVFDSETSPIYRELNGLNNKQQIDRNTDRTERQTKRDQYIPEFENGGPTTSPMQGYKGFEHLVMQFGGLPSER